MRKKSKNLFLLFDRMTIMRRSRNMIIP